MEIIENRQIEEYRAFIEAHAKGHFMQQPEWAAVKNEWKWQGIAQRDASGQIVGALSVLIRPLPGLPFTLMYAPRGPVCDVHDKETVSALLTGVRQLAKKYRAYEFKVDSDVPSSDSDFIQMMLALGFRLHTGGKNFEGIQPRFVFRLNIEGKNEQEVMARFHPKTRYNIRVAVKNGVEVRVCGKEALDEFLPIMHETGMRDGFPTRPKAYFERMLDAFGPHCRLFMAYFEGKPVAGTIAMQYGDKTWYLYGASSNASRNVMPNYLLQWEMIRWAVEGGSRIYDFRGVSGDLSESNPLYGLYRFKKGFNGDFTEFAGEFDLVLNAPVNFAVRWGLRLLKRLRHLKNRRHPAE
ncbi:MAG: peptidoglycan bridge formation glycyltransferase FemA/FemB family protein [Clostridia bacterium]|nr:peptidoglycan bridge formation glycyltransferase FemA/FemB family protein [Clostridia bacterium]MDR3645449.1 peptidoglycan bridge formation glycyltransferase FemA/FemB family protein [Clostridia bacterium]